VGAVLTTQEELEVKSIVDSYAYLSTYNHISFKHTVNIKFVFMKSKNTVGLCLYNKNRTIEIDKEYWDESSIIEKMILLYHELTHCYCDRGHDFGKDKQYPDDSIKSFINSLLNINQLSLVSHEGYFDDSCAFSIMHPILINKKCFEVHYLYYIKEMFEKCDPY
jgi:hypothetical protein